MCPGAMDLGHERVLTMQNQYPLGGESLPDNNQIDKIYSGFLSFSQSRINVLFPSTYQ